MPALPFFDANCTLGRHLKLQPGGLHTAADLLAEMDHYGIGEALVLDCLSRENHPADGNQRVLELTRLNPRLRPAWAALPAFGEDEQPPPEELLAQMRRHQVAALFFFPRTYQFTLADWCVDPFLGPFAAAGVPLFINYNEAGPTGPRGWDETDWEQVVALCRRWPSLPVVVSEWRIRRAQRQIYRALDICPNLHLELSGYWLHRGIEYLTSHWGAQRLLFGSNWPALGQHTTLTTLSTAQISEADQRLIAGDNLRRLAGWCGPRPALPVVFPEPADEYVRFGRNGERPATMKFLDCHGHLGGRAAHYHLPNCDLDGIVRDMDHLGVERICAFAFAGVNSDEQFGNDVVAEAVRRYPERFIGFTQLNPHRGPEWMRAELERGAAMGLRGVKLIPHYQGYPPEGPHIDVACQWAHERQQLILNHHWGSAAQLERLITTYPDACYLTGHTTTEYAALMRRMPNLYVCSCPLLGPRTCEEVVRAIGADRLLFGSDLQDLPIAWGLGPILFARLPAADKGLILGGTLEHLLRRYSLRA
ncbi:MAG: amidohydrolase family protein [Candidatus Latescibacteria bacterium]|nr:amidohydrolase family protein [Candidatus Latescibacterota bacterium]